mmetsp:Transcript_23957/g.50482  ORF Transcript_23957/g.50482 Transcript_23957/m.50482 type:complete len:454 (+) Transcript_23957:28-1389(+)
MDLLSQWQLHPSPLGDHCAYLSSNNRVYIRPKSAKELGVVGTIVGDSSQDYTRGFKKEGNDSSQHFKKRKVTEDARLSVQPLCLEHMENGEFRDNCIFCKRSKSIKQNVRSSRLLPIFDAVQEVKTSCGKSKINNFRRQLFVLVTPDTVNYRLLATSHLRPCDKVLEIGCSTGECTALMLRRMLLLQQQKGSSLDCEGEIVAFDTGSEMIDLARKRIFSELENLVPSKGTQGNDARLRENIFVNMMKLCKVDAITDPKGAQSLAIKNNQADGQESRYPDMVLIDIGGNRELNGVLRMIQWVQSELINAPRIMIIKSEALANSFTQNGVVLVAGMNGNKFYNGIKTDEQQPQISDDGIVLNGQELISSLFKELSGNSSQNPSSKSPPKYSHPKRAPMVLSPKDNSTPICRFHNYHSEGCKKYNRDESECPFDHDHCHWCKGEGHIALNCTNQQE